MIFKVNGLKNKSYIEVKLIESTGQNTVVCIVFMYGDHLILVDSEQ